MLESGLHSLNQGADSAEEASSARVKVNAILGLDLSKDHSY